MKSIPNRHLQALGAALAIPDGLDGELIYGSPNDPKVFNKTTRFVMTADARIIEPIYFFVFDSVDAPGGFAERLETIKGINPFVIKLEQVLITSLEELIAFNQKSLLLGYEGIVTRAPDGPYKFGRSTLREQYLLKVKPFRDTEAICCGFEELESNQNEAFLDERGFTKRTTHQSGKVKMGVLGALLGEVNGVTLRVGTGFTAGDREVIWREQWKYFSRSFTFKYLDYGAKSVESGGTGFRPPYVFKGWRLDL